jgi:hypothetical protein
MRGNPQRYAVGLHRVSTAEQGNSELGLEAQQASVRAFVAAQDWTLVAECSDIASGKDDRSPGFQAALTRRRQLGAGGRTPGSHHPPGAHAVAVAGGRLIHPAADMPGADVLMMRIYAALGAEGTGADQRADQNRSGSPPIRCCRHRTYAACTVINEFPV